MSHIFFMSLKKKMESTSYLKRKKNLVEERGEKHESWQFTDT